MDAKNIAAVSLKIGPLRRNSMKNEFLNLYSMLLSENTFVVLSKNENVFGKNPGNFHFLSDKIQ